MKIRVGLFALALSVSMLGVVPAGAEAPQNVQLAPAAPSGATARRYTFQECTRDAESGYNKCVQQNGRRGEQGCSNQRATAIKELCNNLPVQ